MTPDDEETAKARPRRRRDTQPVLRSAVLLCSEGAGGSEGVARLREIAWERELYVEVATFEPHDAARLVAGRPGTVFIACADEPHDRLQQLRDACLTHGAALVVAETDGEISIRASVAAIEDTIIHRLDPTPVERRDA